MASPWDALLRQPAPPAPPEDDADPARGNGIAARLVAILRERGRMTTAALCRSSGLRSQQVWGCLKYVRERGYVQFTDGEWSLPTKPPEIERAISLLRTHGYRVRPPAALCAGITCACSTTT